MATAAVAGRPAGAEDAAAAAALEFPRYHVPLAQPKPFLMLDPFHPRTVVEVLPSAKKTRISWVEEILVQEIENRADLAAAEDEEDDSYEIEIVDDDGDADFYLEIVDGEVFYVFETEDDISVDDEEDTSSGSDGSGGRSAGRNRVLQLPIHAMKAPNLMGDDDEGEEASSSNLSESVQEGVDSMRLSQDESEKSVGIQDTAIPARPLEPSRANQDSKAKPSPGEQDEGILKTPVGDGKPTVGAVPIVDRLPARAGGIAMPIPPASPSEASRSTTSPGHKSILKSCSDSPKNPKPKKTKTKKAEKTFSKTYVRVDTFDGEHRVYAWQKPDWADQSRAPKLRETGKGGAVREGQNLASPITNLPSLRGVGKNQSHLINADGSIDQEAVLAKLKSGNPFLKTQRLRMSNKGSLIRSGGDIVKPITMATQNREQEQINRVADPRKLRSTAGGRAVKEGKTLALPTTAATQNKKYQFEKPEWAVRRSMRSTENGAMLRQGVDVTAPITQINRSRSSDDVMEAQPSLTRRATTAGLQRTNSDAVKDFTPATRRSSTDGMGTKNYDWERPEWAKKSMVRKTKEGEAIKRGESLSKPITSLPDIVKGNAKR